MTTQSEIPKLGDPIIEENHATLEFHLFLEELERTIGNTGTVTVTQGAGPPGFVPAQVGNAYVDTTNDNVWFATDTLLSTDWKQATGQGGGDLLAANNLNDVSSAATSRTNLDVDQAGTDNSTNVTLSGTGTYISIIGQNITVDPISESDISDLGTYPDYTGTPTLGDTLEYGQSGWEVSLGQLIKEIDDVSGTTFYIGEAQPGELTSAASWRIKRVVFTGDDSSTKYADGDVNFDNIWDNRASLSYS